MANNSSDTEAKKVGILVEWLNSIVPNLNLPIKASEEELRANLIDGTVLCQILMRLRPGSVNKEGYSENSSASQFENVKSFLTALDDLEIPRFEISDLEKGSLKTIVDCLLKLKAKFMPSGENSSTSSTHTKSGSLHHDASSHGSLSPLVEEKRRTSSESKFQRTLCSPVLSEPPPGVVLHHGGHKFHEVFQLKQGHYADLPATKISEMMKSNSLDNAPTQSLLTVVNGILDESVERKNGEIPHRVACLLRKVVQEIERRISTQAEHLRTQNNLFKAREEKYQSRIRVLEALAAGTGEEPKIIVDQLQSIKIEKPHIDEKEKEEQEEKQKVQEDVIRLMKERDENNLEITTLKQEITALKQELEIAKKTYELHCLEMENKTNGSKAGLEERVKELEHLLLEMERKATGSNTGLGEKVKELEHLLANSNRKTKELEQLLADSNTRVKEIEITSESKCKRWSKKENMYYMFMDFQFGALRELRLTSDSIKKEILQTQKSNSEEFNHLGQKLKALADAAENYCAVLAENRKLFNEIQDLKGNIRVYCRVRPFLPGQAGKNTIVESVGENGELTIANPSKPGKDAQRSFRFNKVFGPAATQANVYADIEPFVRSVVDGYNVCIFAYGQTGSGKTYTMTGPNRASGEEWGVNYRALSDLFKISQNRKSTFSYEIGVQMVEIYNEQVRDLLAAVPDAIMHTVTSTSDVLDIMDIGLNNRAVSSTAINERSSRSHSIVTIHVRGKDLKTTSLSYGNLHLVDLAGSERVDRSEVTGMGLKEAQHINKSLAALGDVIFALSQKSSHVPYRNSKLTQVLQSSLGGQAKTLMFVQLNPDATSYSESMSTLKFAERVSGVELGAAKSSKDGRDVRELMGQVSSLKDTIARKDDEIERLQLLKNLKNVHPGVNNEGQRTGLSRHALSSPRGIQLSVKGSGLDLDNCSECSDKRSEVDSQQSMDDERLSDISDGGVSVGTEPDGSTDNVYSPRGTKLSDNLDKSKSMPRSPRLLQKPGHIATTSKDSLGKSPSVKRSISSSSLKPTKRWG
ncbi:hypothetical protein SLA2020_161930 [Shorea laevis]